MTNLIYIAGGGALGALLRYWMSTAIHNYTGHGFPYGTIIVNISGSLLIGFVYVLSLSKIQVSVELKAGIMIGLLGAFTTFSAFSLETITLIESGESLKAAMNITLSVLFCIAGCWSGMLLGRSIY